MEKEKRELIVSEIMDLLRKKELSNDEVRNVLLHCGFKSQDMMNQQTFK